jgi:hypothetical protein
MTITPTPPDPLVDILRIALIGQAKLTSEDFLVDQMQLSALAAAMRGAAVGMGVRLATDRLGPQPGE